MAEQFVTYTGSCHCEAVKFEIQAPTHFVVSRCNCSICTKKQQVHLIVPEACFKLLTDESALTAYSFNTRQAKHLFCSTCGVQSFYRPRSHPDCYSVMPHCLDHPQPLQVTEGKFDGANWEEAMAKKPPPSVTGGQSK